MKLVLNTSSSIFLTRIGLFPHLIKNFSLITSQEIFEEVQQGAEIGYRDANIIIEYIRDKKIKIIPAKKTKLVSKEFRIKASDASIISLAQEENCFLASEDRQIEKICLITNTKIINTAALLYLLWLKKEFSNEQASLLIDLLARNGYNKEICLQIKEKIMKGEKNV